ncbi:MULTISPECIES: hypothetical protein [unclassified Streptomyces]|uniref:hypothetical protein n=1 Tax=unclassified Streptomyces TaxID=2593676 RepID=UPI0005A6C430|nr:MULTISPECIES: hypothetical protein [unclassified Streptomyces]ODA75055.1 hypothetical protein APS67_000767 [Streptomyces sp. AVP053U2]
MSAVRNTIASLVSTVVLAGGLAVGAAGPASAATCPSSASPVISGAKAGWTLSCSGGGVKVYGWLEDTRMDGKCAVVRINAGNGAHRTKSACGSGARKQFSFTFAGTDSAQVRLAIA